MNGVTHPGSAATSITSSRDKVPAPAKVDLARLREHEDEKLDEALEETFPCSDPAASWAGG